MGKRHKEEEESLSKAVQFYQNVDILLTTETPQQANRDTLTSGKADAAVNRERLRDPELYAKSSQTIAVVVPPEHVRAHGVGVGCLFG